MLKNNRVLVLREAWCDNDPNLLLTNNTHNLDATFIKSRPEFHFHRLHFDEAQIVYGKHINEVVVDYCKKYEISIIIMSLQGGRNSDPSMLVDGSPLNPSLACLKELKELGIYMIIMWPDTGPGWGMNPINQLGDIPNLHVSWDNPISDFHRSIQKRDNHLFLWCPQDSNLYYKISEDKKDIPVSFLGSARYYDRQFFLTQLLAHYPSIVVRGGQREEKLTPEKYAELMRRSKISINFSLSPAGFYQTKGRVFEVLACGDLLFEFKNPSTRSLLTPGEDYIEFESSADLIEKIKYYSEHEEERLKISESGYNKYQKNFTAQIFWNTIFSRIKKDLNIP